MQKHTNYCCTNYYYYYKNKHGGRMLEWLCTITECVYCKHVQYRHNFKVHFAYMLLFVRLFKYYHCCIT